MCIRDSNAVMGSVDMAVGEALGNYLEENPKSARIIVEKVIFCLLYTSRCV